MLPYVNLYFVLGIGRPHKSLRRLIDFAGIILVITIEIMILFHCLVDIIQTIPNHQERYQ